METDLVAYTKLARTQQNGTRTNGPSLGKEEERRQATEAKGGRRGSGTTVEEYWD
jgi:hypothetical protein